MSAGSSVSTNAPVDWGKGLSNCEGDEDMFRMMIEKVESLSLDQTMKSLYRSVMDMDHTQVKFYAHALKGPLSYIAADKCVNLAIEINNAALEKNDKKIIYKFLNLVDAAKDLKIYLATQTNKPVNLEELERYGKCLNLNRKRRIAMHFCVFKKN